MKSFFYNKNPFKYTAFEIVVAVLALLVAMPCILYRLYQINFFVFLSALIGSIPTARFLFVNWGKY